MTDPPRQGRDSERSEDTCPPTGDDSLNTREDIHQWAVEGGNSASRESHAVSCKVGEESDLIQNPLRFKTQLGREQKYGVWGRGARP